MNATETLSNLKGKMEEVKKEIGQKEGILQAAFGRIKERFGIKTIDEAYEKLNRMKGEREVKVEQRDELLKMAQEKLATYRR